MEQALHTIKSLWLSDAQEFDEQDEEEVDTTPAETFGLTADRKRCNKCGGVLTKFPFHNLMAWYCRDCKKYICEHCLYPELKLYAEKGKSGVYCTNCGKPA